MTTPSEGEATLELAEYIEMADNRLECEGCQKCIGVARSYLKEALAIVAKLRALSPDTPREGEK